MHKSEINLDKLFGKDRGQEDENLSKYFVKTGQYESIHNGNKELVLGRKGTGKSSLFSYLCLELPKDKIIPIPISPSGEDFALLERILSDYDEMDFDDNYKYSLAWYELIVTQIAFSVISEKYSTLLHGTNSVLYKYLKQNEKLKGDFVTQFANAVLKSFSGGKIKIANNELDIDLSSFSQLGNPEQSVIKKALFETITKNNFFVLVDNLDEPWKNTTQMNCWLRGLILASRKLKRDFQNLKIVIFLRDDIYNEIRKGIDIFDSRNEILTLNWHDKDNFSLRQLLAARISNYLKCSCQPDTTDFDKMLVKLFPLEIERGLSKTYTTKFVADRTFFRPRDFLQFFRSAIDISYSNSLPIPAGALLAAERDFSNWKISSMQGEYSKTYSNVIECINSFAGVTSDWTIKYDVLLKHLSQIGSESVIYNHVEKAPLTPVKMAELLFLMGFLRKVKKSYQRQSYITYLDEANPRLAGTLLDIHPAFRTSLSRLS